MTDSTVIFHALCDYRDVLDNAEIHKKYSEVMAVHSCGINYNLPDLLRVPCKATACIQLRFAWNRYEYHTACALVTEHCKGDSSKDRALAKLWHDYYNDPARKTKAGDEDDARVARAEAAEADRLEDYYR